MTLIAEHQATRNFSFRRRQKTTRNYNGDADTVSTFMCIWSVLVVFHMLKITVYSSCQISQSDFVHAFCEVW